MADEWWKASPLAEETKLVVAPNEDKWWENSKRVAEPLIASPDLKQGNILPFRQGAKGPEFDPAAGILGSLLRTLTTPGDVWRGAIQPGSEEAYQRAADSAWNISPISPSYRAGARFGTVTPLGESTVNPFASADRALFGGMRGNLTKPPTAPPSAADIKAAANAGYNSVRDSGLETPSGPLGALAGDIRSGYGERFSPESAKSTFARLDMMQNPKRSATSIADVMAHRDDLTATIGRGGPDAVAAYEARDALDRFIGDLGQGNVRPSGYGPPAMDPAQIAPTLETARGNTRSAIAANKISGELDPAATGFIEKAEGHAGPGRRAVAMQLSDRAEAILQRNKEIRSFADDEVEALKKVRDGTATRNTLEWFGRRFGGTDLASTLANVSVGTAAGYGGGAGAGLLTTAATQVGGLLAKAAANALARGQTRAAEELVRRNSPLARSIIENQTLSHSPGAGRSGALMRLLAPGLLEEPQSRLPPGYI